MQLQDKIRINPYQLEMNIRAAFYQYDSCCSVNIHQKEKDISKSSSTSPP
jgi:ATP-dependent helicase/DNAse subunit B